MTYRYAPGRGIYVTFDGFTVLLPEWWSVGVIQNCVQELAEVYGG